MTDDHYRQAAQNPAHLKAQKAAQHISANSGEFEKAKGESGVSGENAGGCCGNSPELAQSRKFLEIKEMGGTELESVTSTTSR